MKEFNLIAKEANELSNKNIDVLYSSEKRFLRKIEKKIKKATKYGEFSIEIKICPCFAFRTDTILNIVEEKGFEVSYGFLRFGKEVNEYTFYIRWCNTNE